MGQVFTREAAIAQRETIRASGKRLVFTNGHFDLLHVGHLDYLEKARALGDALFIGINDDDSTTRLKGAGRPLVPAVERARLLAALIPVNGVIVFSGDTAIEIIGQLQPDIYVKGGDYGTHHPETGVLTLSKPLPEQATVESYGGEIRLIDYLPNHSTTALINRVKALPE